MKFQIVKKNITILLLLLSIGILFSCNEKQEENDTSIEKTSSKDNEPIKIDDDNAQKQKTVATNSLGKRLFILCASCHNVNKGEPHKVGPNLYGIFGQKAGITEGFAFSDELIGKDIVWSEETLRKWIENPAEYIPGTKMAFVGVKKTAQQDALITYLQEVTK